MGPVSQTDQKCKQCCIHYRPSLNENNDLTIMVKGQNLPGYVPSGYLTDFKMPYLVHASCVDYILHFKNLIFL